MLGDTRRYYDDKRVHGDLGDPFPQSIADLTFFKPVGISKCSGRNGRSLEDSSGHSAIFAGQELGLNSARRLSHEGTGDLDGHPNSRLLLRTGVSRCRSGMSSRRMAVGSQL